MKCPPGHSCNDEVTGSPPIACSPGFFSYGGQVDCRPCPAGRIIIILFIDYLYATCTLFISC